ncbi:helix-turn-helix transcriptional regulator [Chromohalobacter nigrandesensis]|uniref:helix-turn-helix transcriptional regulator n=1 Tax=Chromohalobacter nigrandesensis TaxID=119863 RepID=UPI001FF6D927|nr:AraC family transcriptional regulator [Chromohalobacter nigrandesensis]MCK0745269.1 AraC family transcriptional regulator [Chromohalobacter nigrandesensis]
MSNECLLPTAETRCYPDRVLTDRHGFHQWLIGLEGVVELEAGGRGAHVDAGRLVTIASGNEHHYLAPGHNRTLVLDLPVDWCEAAGLGDVTSCCLPSMARADIAALVDARPEVLARRLHVLLEQGRAMHTQPRLRLLHLLPVIEADLAAPWRVRDWAARCHMTEAAFARRFRALTGISPHAWLIERRLQRACALMQDPHRPLTEIAQACGFHDSAHFSRAFRARHALSPREWRQRRQSAD